MSDDWSMLDQSDLAALERDWEVCAKYIRHQRIDRGCTWGSVAAWFVDAFPIIDRDRKGQLLGKDLCDWAMKRLGEQESDGWN